MTSRIEPYLPALALAVTAGYSATFPTAGRPGAEVTTLVVLLVLAWLGAPRHTDPLALSTPGERSSAAALPWLAVIGVAVSFALSPVPRAGLGVVLRLLLYLLVPAAVAWCWSTEEKRRRGTALLAAVVAALAVVALLEWRMHGDPRPALPLGHHNLLALWLIATLPLCAWLLWSPRVLAWQRGLAGLAVLLGGGALIATRSLAGALGSAIFLLTLATLAWRGRGRRRRSGLLGAVALVAAVAVLVPLAPRLGEIAAQRDSSVQARAAYLKAGLDGAAARPWSGWGPGASAWTLAEFFEPVPGVHPPGQVLSDLHSVALQLPYELGLPVTLLLLVAGLLWLRRRWNEACLEGTESGGAQAALAGALGLGSALVVSGIFGVEALWLVAAIGVGAAERPGSTETGESALAPSLRGTLATRLICTVLVLSHLPLVDAMRHHAAARSLSSRPAASPAENSEEKSEEALAKAAQLDALPLYQAQQNWLRRDATGAADAARRAQGVAAFWLAAGVAAWSEEGPGSNPAAVALDRACVLDPLGALGPFYRFLVEREPARADRFAARAVLLEPRLLASSALAERAASLPGIAREVRDWPGLPPGWQEEMLATVDQIAALPPPGTDAQTVDLALTVDSDPATSVSLFVFGRQPLSQVIARVPLISDRLAWIDLPSAGVLPEAAGAFRSRSCGR